MNTFFTRNAQQASQPSKATHKHLNLLMKSTFAFLAASLLTVAATAQIASGTTGIDATGNAASEMAACNNGSTQQSRETCMTEVRNAWNNLLKSS